MSKVYLRGYGAGFKAGAKQASNLLVGMNVVFFMAIAYLIYELHGLTCTGCSCGL